MQIQVSKRKEYKKARFELVMCLCVCVCSIIHAQIDYKLVIYSKYNKNPN